MLSRRGSEERCVSEGREIPGKTRARLGRTPCDVRHRHSAADAGRARWVGIATDTLYTDGTNPYFTYAVPSWPKPAWTTVSLAVTVKSGTGGGATNPVPVAVGERLGVAISVEKANTNANAIQILYDHPNYTTRLEVETTTPIDGG